MIHTVFTPHQGKINPAPVVLPPRFQAQTLATTDHSTGADRFQAQQPTLGTPSLRFGETVHVQYSRGRSFNLGSIKRILTAAARGEGWGISFTGGNRLSIKNAPGEEAVHEFLDTYNGKQIRVDRVWSSD